jgi:hypothetical protein
MRMWASVTRAVSVVALLVIFAVLEGALYWYAYDRGKYDGRYLQQEAIVASGSSMHPECAAAFKEQVTVPGYEN